MGGIIPAVAAVQTKVVDKINTLNFRRDLAAFVVRSYLYTSSIEEEEVSFVPHHDGQPVIT